MHYQKDQISKKSSTLMQTFQKNTYPNIYKGFRIDSLIINSRFYSPMKTGSLVDRLQEMNLPVSSHYWITIMRHNYQMKGILITTTDL
jgi:hypothetical protein